MRSNTVDERRMNNMETNWYESIEPYHLGRLSAEETAQFEAAMQADEDLAAAPRAHRTEWEMQELLAENLLRARIRERMAGPPPASGGSAVVRYWKYALLLLLLGGGALFVFKRSANSPPANPPQSEPVPLEMPAPGMAPLQNPAPQPQRPVARVDPPSDLKRIALTYYHPPADLSGIRGQNDDDHLTLATRAFFKKDYPQVLRLLDTLPEADRQEALSLRAHTYFSIGKYRAAARDFEALKAGGIYRREAEWYLLLSHMATPDVDKATLKAELDWIRSLVNHPYQKEAEGLLKSPFFQ